MAFEAAARHGSFSLAAQELVVTDGAISRQVARLEAFLGVSLFLRGGNRVELTAHGERYAEELGRLLVSLEQSTFQVMTTPPQQRVLELASIGTFATRWLIPRLPLFLREHPDVVVNLSTRNDPFVLNGSVFDAAITFAHPAWAGAESRHLFRSSLIPVCDPLCCGAAAQIRRYCRDCRCCTRPRHPRAGATTRASSGLIFRTRRPGAASSSSRC
ncbi:LysR family transcriptional regulator [Prescottella defluvii]|nr:LysR family transcriptional regulator [Prescottella defluvii]